jgi:hypothetical protein
MLSKNDFSKRTSLVRHRHPHAQQRSLHVPRSHPELRKSTSRASSGIGDDARSDKAVPHEKNDHGAYGRTDKSGALIWTVPADRLAYKRCNKCSGDTEHGGENESRRIIRTRRDQPRYDTCNKADQNNPKNTHRLPPFFESQISPCSASIAKSARVCRFRV